MNTRRFAPISLIAFAASLLATAPALAQSSDWRRVQALAPGAPVVVSRAGVSGVSDRRVVFADADVLVALNLTGLELNDREVASLVEAADKFTRPTPGRAYEAVNVDTARIASDGVWIGAQRIGDAAQRIERITRASVVEIRKPGRTTGSKIGAVIGVAGGAFLGFATALHFGIDNPCGRSCNDERAVMAAPIVGMPIGGGLLGYNARRHTVSEVIYRR